MILFFILGIPKQMPNTKVAPTIPLTKGRATVFPNPGPVLGFFSFLGLVALKLLF